jgi:hypothetical protein
MAEGRIVAVMNAPNAGARMLETTTRAERMGGGRCDAAREPTGTAETYRRYRRLSTIAG